MLCVACSPLVPWLFLLSKTSVSILVSLATLARVRGAAAITPPVLPAVTPWLPAPATARVAAARMTDLLGVEIHLPALEVNLKRTAGKRVNRTRGGQWNEGISAQLLFHLQPWRERERLSRDIVT